jgi:uroporphyrin-III C-methyltransferase / precorrin-2 dehydrogenase / sirohydrochlorin ferrochelatase
MRQFPAFFNMDDASVVVFGGGEEARRKVRLLAATPARITVIVSEIEPGFAEEFAGRITIAPPEQAGPALDVARFAIVANRFDRNAEKAITMARQYGVPLNVVDHPELCDFTVPSIIDRGDVVAAIGTNGTAPVLAKSIRERLEALLPRRIGDLAALAARLRPEVKAAIPDNKGRRRFWENALTGPIADLAYAGDLDGAEAAMRAGLHASAPAGGIVHIVGAGPGDPELLTLKALRLIQEADIVYYDRLVSAEILTLIRRDADRVPVGKSKGDHSVPQETIHEWLIASACEGKRVVRLKGGDPFIFGRGGEELEAVRSAGVAATVVPGISSALGCAANAGLPLTHRDHAQSLTFVTGHAKEGGVPDLDWAALARPTQTVVVFMGVGTAAAIAEKIIAAGRAPSTPVAVIENGTRDNEIRVFGTLSQLASLIQRAGIKGPALLFIGEVAALPEEAIARAFKEHVA